MEEEATLQPEFGPQLTRRHTIPHRANTPKSSPSWLPALKGINYPLPRESELDYVHGLKILLPESFTETVCGYTIYSVQSELMPATGPACGFGAIHTTTHTGRFFEGYRLWERRHQKPTIPNKQESGCCYPSSSSDGRQRACSSHTSQYHRKHRRSDRIDFDQDPSVHDLRVAMADVAVVK